MQQEVCSQKMSGFIDRGGNGVPDHVVINDDTKLINEICCACSHNNQQDQNRLEDIFVGEQQQTGNMREQEGNRQQAQLTSMPGKHLCTSGPESAVQHRQKIKRYNKT